MDTRVKTILRDCKMRPGADPEALEALAQSIGMRFPHDYVAFILDSNGVEGFVGDNYLWIWPLEQIPLYRKLCDEMPYIVFIASDGDGEGFAYDTRSSPPPIVHLPFIGMEEKLIRVLGRSILEFLERLERAPFFP
jgi:hypothetical protein